jgi:hypothetical protein
MSQVILSYIPLSVGWNDIVRVDMKRSVKSALDKADKIYERMSNYGNKEREMLSRGIDSIYGRLTDEATDSSRGVDNGLITMIKSGGRGKPRDYRDMAVLIGQQYYTDGEKVVVNNLPIAGDAPVSIKNGFIPVSYSSGMDPISMWISACSARNCIVHSKTGVQDGGNFMRLFASTMSNVRAYHGICHSGSVYMTQLTIRPSATVITKIGPSIVDIRAELKKLRAN